MFPGLITDIPVEAFLLPLKSLVGLILSVF